MPHFSTIRSGTLVTAFLMVLCMLSAACGQQLSPAGAAEDVADREGGFLASLMPPPRPAKDCKGLGKWLARNGGRFTSRVERPGFVLEASYRPAACTACMEAGGSTFADSAFQQRVVQLKATELYVLKVSARTDKQDTLNLEISDILMGDLIEVVGSDTFPCSFLHVEAVPSMLPYRTALVGFDRPQDGRDRHLVLHDPEGRFGGAITLTFPEGGLGAYLAIAPDTLTSPRS